MATERTPFDSIEDSLEYIGLLRDTIETSKRAVKIIRMTKQIPSRESTLRRSC